MSAALAMDVLLEELMDLHASNSSFRDLFKLKDPTEILLYSLKTFMNIVASNSTYNTPLQSGITRVFEKCSVLAGMMAHTLSVLATQRDEVCDFCIIFPTRVTPFSSLRLCDLAKTLILVMARIWGYRKPAI